MKPHHLITAALIAASSVIGARAAEPAPTSTPPAFTWAGLHIGVNAGAGFPEPSGARVEAAAGFAPAAYGLVAPNRDRPGVSFGAQIGYDWQKGPWVYGLETELNFLKIRRGDDGVFAGFGPATRALTTNENGDYFASVRARFGYAFGRSLVYMTGGVAAGGWRGASLLTVSPGAAGPFLAPLSQSSRMKFVVGAGIEQALFDRWSARLEYTYVNQQLQTRLFDDGAASAFAARQRSEAHVLRLGLNYRFDPQEEAEAPARDSARHVDDETGKNGKKTGRENGQRNEKRDEASKEELYSFHGQTTAVVQGYPKFPALYSGERSFPPNGLANAGSTSNLFFGLRLWDGGAVYLNPEIDVGYGLANSVGAAAYVDGAVAKVGRAAPYMRFQRYFLRQIIGLDGGGKVSDPETGSFNEVLESTQNQLSGKVDKDRIILTIGKFAVPDVFDDNKYAHDPTTGFLNFGVNSMGAFDYAADSWGYTHGLAIEWKQDWWTARAGAFQLSDIPNSPNIEPQIGRQFMGVVELEARYDLFAQPGVIKFLAYGDNGNFAKVDDVVNYALLTGALPPDVNLPWLRRRHLKLGGGINVQQQISKEIGFFLRASMADGRFETVDFTDIDRSLATGLTLQGALWGRDKDEIGLAGVFSGLAGPRIRYFGLGGLSVYIGDGGISYAGEKVFETYYKYNMRDGIELTLDYQFIGNPGHNVARGPVNVFGLRLHAQF
ncbi:carbohydrate porin [Methylosinus sp. Sm6]|nr:carbohydrate porin [Methylosinus sp. Sm6]